MKKGSKKSEVQEFADSIRDNPEKIIAWALREIEEYRKLIVILEKSQSKGGDSTGR